MKVDSNEVVEPLDDGKIIIQPKDGYRFGGDAVALFRFASAHIGSGDKVFDLCSGCGIVGILVAISTGAEVTGAEIDGALCDMSVRSAAANGLDGVKFFNADIRKASELPEVFMPKAYDAVVCNPPFFKADSRARKTAPSANSEITATFSDAVNAAAVVLKCGGELFVVHTASRLDEVLGTCSGSGLMPKELVINANGKTFLLRAVKGGRQGMTVRTEAF